MDTMSKIETKLLDVAEEIGKALEVDRHAAFDLALDKICNTTPGAHTNGRIAIDSRDLTALKYLTTRNKIGLGVLQPLAWVMNTLRTSVAAV